MSSVRRALLAAHIRGGAAGAGAAGPRTAVGGGGGGEKRPSRIKRSGLFGISNSTSKDYGYLKFKSPVFKEAAMVNYSCIFPLHGYLPQVCGPFRPITTESIGGMPQSMAQEASTTGGPINLDEI